MKRGDEGGIQGGATGVRGDASSARGGAHLGRSGSMEGRRSSPEDDAGGQGQEDTWRRLLRAKEDTWRPDLFERPVRTPSEEVVFGGERSRRP